MNNLFQYTQKRDRDKQAQQQQRAHQFFLSKRENFKHQASISRTHRFTHFLDLQVTSPDPLLIPDEYMHKKAHLASQLQSQRSHIFNTGESTPPFMSKERPHLDRSSMLVKRESSFSLFGTTQLSRHSGKTKGNSMKKEELKLTREDLGQLCGSLPLRQTSDKKVSESAITFQNRAQKVADKFEGDKTRWEEARVITKDRYRLCQQTHFDSSKISRVHSFRTPRKTQFSVENEEEGPSSQGYLSEIGEERRRRKTYFKLAKTTQLFATGVEKAELDKLLWRSHYDRVKSRVADETFRSGSMPKGQQSVDMSVLLPS